MIKLTDVSRKYRTKDGGLQVLSNLSMHVESGDFVAVTGESGCGKSTLLLAIGTMLAPTSGEVELVGEKPYNYASDKRAHFRAANIGFVFQQFHLIPYLSVRDNILAAGLATSGGINDRTDELIEQFGLGSRSSHIPGRLSTGERQRTALARALVNSPKILLADEPTGNLDKTNSQAVLDAMKKFADDGGAVVLVTHDSDAAEFADKQLKLVDGAIQGV